MDMALHGLAPTSMGSFAPAQWPAREHGWMDMLPHVLPIDQLMLGDARTSIRIELRLVRLAHMCRKRQNC